MDSVTQQAEPFSIPATVSMQERRPRTLKDGDTFAVLDNNGDISFQLDGADGLYHRDTRYLSRLELLVCGVRPMLLSSSVRDDNATLTCDLSNPDAVLPDGRELDHDLVHIRRTKFVHDSTCFERLALRNYSDRQQVVTVDVGYVGDFVDLFEVRGMSRARRGTLREPVVSADRVCLSYVGLDEQVRATTIRFSPTPVEIDGRRARFEITLDSHSQREVYVEACCDHEPPSTSPRDAFFTAMRAARRGMRATSARAASVATDNAIFNEAMRRSIADLTMLITDTPEGPYPYAGIPWYSTVFGRDAIITALQTLWLDPEIARGVLGFLAANQATHVDAAADAEPGKILHEMRQGEMAELGEVPFRRYYGSVDSTPLFLMLAGAYLDRTGDVATLGRLWPEIQAALGWIDRDGDRDQDGFVEYFRQTKEGLANQGWKDSFDSIFHADGQLAEGPLALCEVQGYVYAAVRAVSRIAAALGFEDQSNALADRAEALRLQIEDSFWSDELGSYALALDGEKKPCLTRASNAGHLLLAGVPSRERAGKVASLMLGGTMFSGWGVRTVATDAARYNPMSYHNGSVWPHDNALIGIGLAHYGFRAEAARILEGMFDASTYIEQRRLPELICGFRRRRNQGPTFYPVACAPQAWSATALQSLLQSCLGLRFDMSRRMVVFDRPYMPSVMHEVVLRQLAIGPARIDVMVRGRGEEVSMQVLSRSGDIRAGLFS